jgi:hypothetical protein
LDVRSRLYASHSRFHDGDQGIYASSGRPAHVLEPGLHVENDVAGKPQQEVLH